MSSNPKNPFLIRLSCVIADFEEERSEKAGNIRKEGRSEEGRKDMSQRREDSAEGATGHM